MCVFVHVGAQAFTGAYFGERYGPIVYDNLGCTGNEKNISQCPGNQIGIHNCDHSEDAGIRCQGEHLVCVFLVTVTV